VAQPKAAFGSPAARPPHEAAVAQKQAGPPTEEGAAASTIQPYRVLHQGNIYELKAQVLKGAKTPYALVRKEGLFPAQEWIKKRKSFLRQGAANVVYLGNQIVTLRVSDDCEMAIEDADLRRRQPKAFFATEAVIARSNEALRRVGSPIQLVATNLQVYIYDNHRKQHELKQVIPRAKRKVLADPFQMEAPQECNNIAGFVVGARSADSDLETPTGRELTQAPDGRPSILSEIELYVGHELARRMKTTGPADHLATIEGIPAFSDDPLGDRRTKDAAILGIATEYVAALKTEPKALASELRELRINQYANPAIAQSYVIVSIAGEDAQHKIKDLLTGRSFVPQWKYHFGAVVARSGVDTVTLENYARNDEDKGDPGADPRWYFQMYGASPGQSFHEANVATGGFANALTLVLARPQEVAVPVVQVPVDAGSWQKRLIVKIVVGGALLGGVGRYLGYI
jgi:hypothetical protein